MNKAEEEEGTVLNAFSFRDLLPKCGLFLPSRLAASSIGDRLNKEIASFGGGNFFVEIVEKSRCLQYIFLFVYYAHTSLHLPLTRSALTWPALTPNWSP